jgi:hypothetical protein
MFPIFSKGCETKPTNAHRQAYAKQNQPTHISQLQTEILTKPPATTQKGRYKSSIPKFALDHKESD